MLPYDDETEIKIIFIDKYNIHFIKDSIDHLFRIMNENILLSVQQADDETSRRTAIVTSRGPTQLYRNTMAAPAKSMGAESTV